MTWSGNNATWTELNFGTSALPSARATNAMVYNSTRQSVILFGGDDDIWTLSFTP
jgi:hypothetical protein